MRSLIAFLLTAVAMVATVIAVPAMWASTQVVDRDNFVSMVKPLGTSPEVRNLISQEIASNISAQTNGLVQTAQVKTFTDVYTRSDQFPNDFADVMAQQHDHLFQDNPSGSAQAQTMKLDLTAMVRQVLAQNAIRGISPNTQVVIPVSESQRSGLEAGRYRELGDYIDRLAIISTVVALAAALGALVVARRRGRILVWLGIGGLIAGGLSLAASYPLQSRAEDEVAGAAQGPQEVATLMIGKVADSWHLWAYVSLGAGVVLIAMGVLVSLLTSRSRY